MLMQNSDAILNFTLLNADNQPLDINNATISCLIKYPSESTTKTFPVDISTISDAKCTLTIPKTFLTESGEYLIQLIINYPSDSIKSNVQSFFVDESLGDDINV